MGPAELQRAFGEVQAALANAGPRLRALAARPGAAELRAGVLSALSRRALARTIKAVLGPQARHALALAAACSQHPCDTEMYGNPGFQLV